MSRSYLLAQSLEDMHSVGAIKCAKLSRRAGDQTSSFYDTTAREDCPLQTAAEVSLKGLDGNDWEFVIVPNISFSFYVIKWATLLTTGLLILIAYWFAVKILSRERAKLQETESKRIFIEDLAKQVSHDVASPMSALRMIAARAPLDPSTKQFLQDAVDRTEGIFSTLNNIKKPAVDFRLDAEVRRIVEEKLRTDADFPEIQLTVGSYAIESSKIEFGRVISNLLNNAKEAGAKHIWISSAHDDNSIWLIVADDGQEMPSNIRANFGIRGNTSGKPDGSGLGLHHAAEWMSSLGGKLIPGEGNQKVILVFPSSKPHC